MRLFIERSARGEIDWNSPYHFSVTTVRPKEDTQNPKESATGYRKEQPGLRSDSARSFTTNAYFLTLIRNGDPLSVSQSAINRRWTAARRPHSRFMPRLRMLTIGRSIRTRPNNPDFSAASTTASSAINYKTPAMAVLTKFS